MTHIQAVDTFPLVSQFQPNIGTMGRMGEVDKERIKLKFQVAFMLNYPFGRSAAVPIVFTSTDLRRIFSLKFLDA